MALIRGNTQIIDHTIPVAKLENDFLNAVNWNITNGNNNATITGLADPINSRDVPTKQYVDNLVQGIKGQFVARVRAQANVAALTGAQTIDGVALVDGDNVLLDSQTTTTEDGLYTVRAGAWERVSSWEVGESVGAFFVFIEEGTDDNKGFVCTNDKGSDVIGTDDLVFTQFSAAGSINAGAGLTQNGSDFDVIASDASLTINANDMSVNIGNTNGDSLEVSTTGLELRSTINGTRSFVTNNGNYSVVAGTGNVEITSDSGVCNFGATNTATIGIGNVSSSETQLMGGAINFKDGEVNVATVQTAIPFAITATVNYGNGNGTAAGDVINQFRADFTDKGIVNALCELNGRITASTLTVGNGLSNNSGVIEAGDTTSDSITWDMNDNQSIFINTNGYVGANHRSLNAQFYGGAASGSDPAINFSVNDNYGMQTLSGLNLHYDHAIMSFMNSSLRMEDSIANGGIGGKLEGGLNNWSLDTAPDGTVSLAIATVGYVKSSISNSRNYNEATTLDVGNQTATLTNAPTTGFTNGVVYLNGLRLVLTTDYTITNATTGEITFTASQTLTAGDVVIMDYTDA